MSSSAEPEVLVPTYPYGPHPDPVPDPGPDLGLELFVKGKRGQGFNSDGNDGGSDWGLLFRRISSINF